MKFLENPSLDPHYNMAFDEYCLQSLKPSEPIFYLWRNAPSVIIGLNQNAYSEVNIPYLESKGIFLARRVTGGGAVYHDLQNLNYTITGRADELEKYVNIISDALRSMGVPVEVSGRNDLLLEGRKVSGYAKRVWQDRIMFHGTLLFDVDFDSMSEALSVPGSKLEAAGVQSVRSRVANLKEYLPFGDVLEFKGALEKILSCGEQALTLSNEQLGEVETLAREKFRTWEWNFGKSAPASFSAASKFACGSVSVTFDVEHGYLQNLNFGGDFLGNLPSEGLAKALDGCKYSREDLFERISGLEVSEYFDGLSREELLSILL